MPREAPVLYAGMLQGCRTYPTHCEDSMNREELRSYASDALGLGRLIDVQAESRVDRSEDEVSELRAAAQAVLDTREAYEAAPPDSAVEVRAITACEAAFDRLRAALAAQPEGKDSDA